MAKFREVKNILGTAIVEDSILIRESRLCGQRQLVPRKSKSEPLRVQRKLQLHEQSAIHCVHSSHRTSMHANNPFRDGQTQAGPVGIRSLFRKNSIERQKDLREVRVGHARSIITYLDEGHCSGRPWFPLQGDFDLRMCLGVEDAISNNVFNSSADLV